MGTVHFLREDDRHHMAMEALSKQDVMMEEIRGIHQKVGGLIDQANALMDGDLKALLDAPNYKFDNGVRESLNQLREEREILQERAELLIIRASEYLDWYDQTFRK